MTDRPEKTNTGALRLTVLGARGSMPVGGADRVIFGGATSCYMVRSGADCVFLDAGSGLLSAPADCPGAPLILLSHLHLDHVLGLGMFPRLSRKGTLTLLRFPATSGQNAERPLDGLYAPPWWPVGLKQYVGALDIAPVELPMRHGRLYIEGVRGNHPGGCLIYRVSGGGRSLVYATDYEHDEPSFGRLADFARGTDLLLYDSQFSPAEYARKRGYGHSTAEKGMELMARCGAKRLLLIHHDPQSTDAALLERERRIGRADVRFAREGEVIEL